MFLTLRCTCCWSRRRGPATLRQRVGVARLTGAGSSRTFCDNGPMASGRSGYEHSADRATDAGDRTEACADPVGLPGLAGMLLWVQQTSGNAMALRLLRSGSDGADTAARDAVA